MLAASAGGRLLVVVMLRWWCPCQCVRIVGVGSVDLAGRGRIDDCTYGTSFRQLLQLFRQDAIFPNTVAKSESYREIRSCQQSLLFLAISPFVTEPWPWRERTGRDLEIWAPSGLCTVEAQAEIINMVEPRPDGDAGYRTIALHG